MSGQEAGRIARDRLDEPHVEGRRVSVLNIQGQVEENGTDPETVAEQFEIDVADVYHALAYYHDHPEEMAAVERARSEALRRTEREARRHRPEGVEPSDDDE